MTPLRRALARRAEDRAADAAPVARLAPRGGARVQMARPLRATVFAVCALLWSSGVAWLVLHFAFPQQGAFGPLPNPWEPLVMRVHGLIAVGAVFLLGWLAAGHVRVRWASARNRLSGLVLAGSGALLIASGYALYYSTGALHDVAALTHEWLGVAAIAAALAHWWRTRATR